AAFAGQTVNYASLEIVLVDANDRMVGWGNTRTGWPDDGNGSPPTNGVGGTVMTLTLRQFPQVKGSWVLNGKNAAFSAQASYAWLPVSPYKRVDTSLIPAVTLPGAPTVLTATAGNAQVALSWSSPVSNGGAVTVDYVVQFSSNGGATWNTFADGVSTATNATITGLANGTAYVFRVAAVNSVGTGSYATTPGSVTPATTPGAPTSLMAAAGNALVVLAWTAPADNGGSAITDYAVQFSSNSGATWTTFADGTSTATTATVTGLTNGTSYAFRVAAVNSAGVGAYSTLWPLATPRTVPGSPIFALSGFATAGNAQVALSWTAPADNGGSAITDYVVQFSSNSGSTWTTFADGTSTA
ncbi:MAG: fibronectin type III domain-containing protein, partial [Synechococcaceae bacterium WBB_34_004]|nr:fibronectin type III domain-containing protein [Synechococcaceae bacterium WBB_34_004]